MNQRNRTSRNNQRFMLICAVMIIVCVTLFIAGCREKAVEKENIGNFE